MHLEFFHQPTDLTSDDIMVIRNGEYLPLSSLSEEILKVLYLRMLESDQATRIIHLMKKYGITQVKDQVRQFVMCNFSTLNRIDDLDEEGKLNFEFVKCACRNHGCKFNSELCIRKY
jgi:hypothetical protein